MNGFGRRTRAGVCAALALSMLLMIDVQAGAVRATRGVDPCSLVTNEDLLGMQSPATLDSTDTLSPKHCRYRLGGSSTINLFVGETADFKTDKARVKKVRKVRGLPSGYSGEIAGGDAQVGFKSHTNAIRLTSSVLAASDLIVVAKAVEQHL
jgi:hypothetical protein